MAQVIRIAPLSSGSILPAIVIGFEEQGYSGVEPIVHELAERPPWLITLDQQAGGACMTYHPTFGCVLRLCDNVEFCSGNFEELQRAFSAMAEDPQMDVLRRDFPAISKLVFTHGGDYSASELRGLWSFLKPYFSFPPFDSGLEAFIRFADSEPTEWFADWKMLSVKPSSQMPLEQQDNDCILVEDWNNNWLSLSSNERFGASHLHDLRQFGKKLEQGEPHIFLLWENSD